MVDSNYNMIQPVESLQTIAGMTPVKQREERKRQKDRKHRDGNEHDAEKTLEESFETQPDKKVPELQGDSNSIDFCA